jgi:hypothetical protein
VGDCFKFCGLLRKQNFINLFFFRTSQIIKKDETIQIQETIMKDIKTDICENRQKAANAWKNVMKGPPTAPVCKGGIISEDRFNLVPFSKKKL